MSCGLAVFQHKHLVHQSNRVLLVPTDHDHSLVDTSGARRTDGERITNC